MLGGIEARKEPATKEHALSKRGAEVNLPPTSNLTGRNAPLETVRHFPYVLGIPGRPGFLAW